MVSGRVLRVPGLGRVALLRGPGQAQLTADQLFSTRLELAHYRDGRLVDYEDLGDGLVTTAGVTLLAQDWTNSTATLKAMKYIEFGTSATSPTISQTALLAPCVGTSGRGVAVMSNPVAGQLYVVGSVVFTQSYSVSEFGLFNAASGGTMWDRRTFTPRSVNVDDSLEARYTLTISAGG